MIKTTLPVRMEGYHHYDTSIRLSAVIDSFIESVESFINGLRTLMADSTDEELIKHHNRLQELRLDACVDSADAEEGMNEGATYMLALGPHQRYFEISKGIIDKLLTKYGQLTEEVYAISIFINGRFDALD